MFKSVFVATVVLAATVNSAQAVELVNKDGSALTDACISAAVSGKSLRKQEVTNIRCNGMSLNSFVRKYRSSIAAELAADAQKEITFENANRAPESEVCIAAATSNEEFSQVVSRLGIKTNNVECNGVKLQKFAKRYNKQFKS